MNKNKMFIGSLLLVVILIGCLSYSIWTITKTQEEENIFSTGCFDIAFTEDTTQIEITDAYPLSTKEGMKQTPFTFTLTNKCTTTAEYQVNLEVLATTTLDQQYVVAALNNTQNKLTTYPVANSTIAESTAYQLTTGSLKGCSAENKSDGGTIKYNLRLWVATDATNFEMNKYFAAKVVVTAVSTNES